MQILEHPLSDCLKTYHHTLGASCQTPFPLELRDSQATDFVALSVLLRSKDRIPNEETHLVSMPPQFAPLGVPSVAESTWMSSSKAILQGNKPNFRL